MYEFLSQPEAGVGDSFVSTLVAAAVKSAKTHLRRVVEADVRRTLNFVAQIEACLNSRSLVPVNVPDGDGIEVLTPGHF